jgi:hypothetical protein
MPVQFRCSLCRKKLKVSRRKSGSDVACPNCGGSTTVPTASDMDAELDQFLSSAGGVATVQAPPKPKSRKIPKVKPQQKLDDLPLFEREDFAELLDKDDAEAEDLDLAPATETAASPATRVVEADAIVMSRSTLTMYVIAVLSLLGLAFAAGFLVGGK